MWIRCLRQSSTSTSTSTSNIFSTAETMAGVKTDSVSSFENRTTSSSRNSASQLKFIVVSFGPSYRPLFTADRHSYTVRLNDSANAFKADMAGLRRQIRLHNRASHGRSPSKVIWSLLPHMGVIEGSEEASSGRVGERR
jgi:hypothetical protein